MCAGAGECVRDIWEAEKCVWEAEVLLRKPESVLGLLGKPQSALGIGGVC